MARRVADNERQSASELLVPLLRERRRRLAANTLTPVNDRHLRELCSLLLWKYSEAAGKYRGCRYWSVGALASKQKHGRLVTSKLRYGEDALRHEHLFPRQQQIAALFEIEEPTAEEVRARLDQLNIGVVVTEGEHRRLEKHGEETDPWNRYRKAGLAWEDQHDA
jgi:hypothetical protein